MAVETDAAVVDGLEEEKRIIEEFYSFCALDGATITRVVLLLVRERKDFLNTKSSLFTPLWRSLRPLTDTCRNRKIVPPSLILYFIYLDR